MNVDPMFLHMALLGETARVELVGENNETLAAEVVTRDNLVEPGVFRVDFDPERKGTAVGLRWFTDNESGDMELDSSIPVEPDGVVRGGMKVSVEFPFEIQVEGGNE